MGYGRFRRSCKDEFGPAAFEFSLSRVTVGFAALAKMNSVPSLPRGEFSLSRVTVGFAALAKMNSVRSLRRGEFSLSRVTVGFAALAKMNSVPRPSER
ncbi:hypothetical protein L596_000508 [Steinernema carpocapsae]|uniref:Uncharacterized protein n=1 Tax=Steinernema carpocapsae TaxID=34508 RepID=A0A4U8UJ65_STECR|nr:hypothetical protein L596_000508 [Steinernema carpocapsae]